MHRWPLLLVLLLAGCADDSMTRHFSLSRDSAPETVAATEMPLSMPPSLAMRPPRPGAIVPQGGDGGDAQAPEQQPGSQGQEALVEAAGPPPPPDVRAAINQNAGLVYPDQGFVDRLMNWTPTPGATPIITQGSTGGWFSRLF